jgi:hypothetical protein
MRQSRAESLCRSSQPASSFAGIGAEVHSNADESSTGDISHGKLYSGKQDSGADVARDGIGKTFPKIEKLTSPGNGRREQRWTAALSA